MDNKESTYNESFTQTYLTDEEYALFDLSLTDDMLQKMLVDDLNANVDYWNQKPWDLENTDKDNVNFLLGNQNEGNRVNNRYDNDEPDNRLFSGVRAILAYATGQLATPEITPSRSDDSFVKMARSMQTALYQHAADEKVEQKVRAAVLNLVTRKRGYLKLRFDPNIGAYGDVITEVCNPEDITIDREAPYLGNPNKIYHRLHMTVDEACLRWPKKANDIKIAYSIKQGRWTQMTRMIHPYECWFSYWDDKGKPCEGVCWFIQEHNLILDKMPNPNWLYEGSLKVQKEKNVTPRPPKPFTYFNFLNFGKSFIDETCLFEQAKPQQMILNRRNRQFNQNVDLMNGRWVASRKAMSEEDAYKIINKGSKTVAMVNAEDVGKALQVLTPEVMPAQVYQSIQDTRNEIDIALGTPSIFKGENPSDQNTATRDLMQKQQAGMLQDDLVRAIQTGMELYYEILLQMMLVYFTDDYWFSVKGGNGKFDFIMLNGDNIDSNVKIGVQTDSTLPIDKERQRALAIELAQMQRIDQLSLLEDLGVPDPDVRTERWIRSQIDMYTYMQSIETSMDNNDAEVDLQLVIAGKQPDERDNYDQGYIEYLNHFITLNRFAKLDQDIKKRILAYVMIVQHQATQTANLQGSALNDAGIINRPPIFPLPKRTENIRLQGMMSPQQTQQIAGQEGQMFTPITGAEQAQDPSAGPAPGAPQVSPTPGQ